MSYNIIILRSHRKLIGNCRLSRGAALIADYLASIFSPLQLTHLCISVGICYRTKLLNVPDIQFLLFANSGLMRYQNFHLKNWMKYLTASLRYAINVAVICTFNAYNIKCIVLNIKVTLFELFGSYFKICSH